LEDANRKCGRDTDNGRSGSGSARKVFVDSGKIGTCLHLNAGEISPSETLDRIPRVEKSSPDCERPLLIENRCFEEVDMTLPFGLPTVLVTEESVLSQSESCFTPHLP